MKSKEFRDAVHDDIEFDEFELNVINTPQFQRMRGIRQLGLAHLVYPCAQHTRFEHSLGVAHMAERIVRAVNKDEEKIADNERRFIRALALIHDIGHIPFGHTLEDERPVYGKVHHHDCEARLAIFLRDTELGASLTALGKAIGHSSLVEDLIRVMKRTHETNGDLAPKLGAREELFAAIVGNTICADLLDYLKRDPYFTGIQHRYDNRIISAFEIKGDQIYLDLDDRGHLRRSVLSEILHLLRLRYTLGERVYYYPTKSAASAMISKSVELSGLSHSTLAPLRDEELLFVLEDGARIRQLGSETVQNTELVSRLIKNIRTRKLHVPAYTITLKHADHRQDDLVALYHDHSSISERRTAEEELAKNIGATTDQVIIYCPSKGMASKAAMVNVSWPNEGRLRPLQELCEDHVGIEDATIREEIRQLKQKHASLWQMTVFIDPALQQRQGELSAHCQKLFFDIPNCSPGYRGTPVQSLRNKLMLEAVLTDPNPETIDRNACLQQLNMSSFQEDGPWTVPEVRARLPRMFSLNGLQEPIERPAVKPVESELFPNAAGHLVPTGDGSMPSGWSPLMFELPSDEQLARFRNRAAAKEVFEVSRSHLIDALNDLWPATDDAGLAKSRRIWSSFQQETFTKGAARKGKGSDTILELTRSKDEWTRVLRAKDEF